MSDQQRLRSACTYPQSDQSLCLSFEYSMIVKLLPKHLLVVVSLKGGCTGLFESTFVKMPHCCKSHAAAHMVNHSQAAVVIFLLMVVYRLLLLLIGMRQSELPRSILWNSVESDLGCTSRIYFDNVTLMLLNLTLTSQKPCCDSSKLKLCCCFFFQ